jgi:hypothetical protein
MMTVNARLFPAQIAYTLRKAFSRNFAQEPSGKLLNRELRIRFESHYDG